MSQKIRIILVDDHEMVLAGLSAELSKLEEFDIVKAITNPGLVIDLVNQHNPDVIIMDIRMGKYNGLDLTNELKSMHPNLKIILISGYNIGTLAKDCGADAFAPKEASISSLVSTIHKVYFDEAIVFPNKSNSSPKILTKTETIILQLISEDKTRKEICDQLYIADKTVTNHINSILRKLEVRSRVGAIMKGVELGLINNKYQD